MSRDKRNTQQFKITLWDLKGDNRQEIKYHDLRELYEILGGFLHFDPEEAKKITRKKLVVPIRGVEGRDDEKWEKFNGE